MGWASRVGVSMRVSCGLKKKKKMRSPWRGAFQMATTIPVYQLLLFIYLFFIIYVFITAVYILLLMKTQ